jgi:hypothetical protein
LILIRHAERQPIQACGSPRCEVKNELVTVVDEPIAVDRLVVADREIPCKPGGRASRRLIDRNRLYPVNDVLHPQMRPDSLRDVERRPRIARLGPHVEEEGAVRAEHTSRGGHPSVRPLEILGRREGVLVPAVLNPEVVRRRGHDHVDALGWELPEYFEAVLQVETARRAACPDAVIRLKEDGHRLSRFVSVLRGVRVRGGSLTHQGDVGTGRTAEQEQCGQPVTFNGPSLMAGSTEL